MSDSAKRPVKDSFVEMNEIVFPNDANPLGKLMGGRVMQWVDICAAIAAGRHARGPVVTANIDQLDFLRPVPVGGVVTLLGCVNFCGRTSMEVGVKVFHEDRSTGERHHVVSAYLTFVAVDGDTSRPIAVADVIPETDEQKRRYSEARARREHRMAERG